MSEEKAGFDVGDEVYIKGFDGSNYAKLVIVEKNNRVAICVWGNQEGYGTVNVPLTLLVTRAQHQRAGAIAPSAPGLTADTG